MPRFFFDTHDGDRPARDPDGMDLRDRDEARRMALDALPDVARDKLPDGDRRTFMAAVRDEAGVIIYRATLSLKGDWISEGGTTAG